ncbi:hypothetical protein F383_11694 [Gossypium arboreum]|uniref:Uncharacterized protein n=1 Tax=Gossypium arboreum TaxID=29729 RepID=A0A0B0NAE3_GOSAR|nr:hypothetical protein F383_11694 [Gossypium arboreum]
MCSNYYNINCLIIKNCGLTSSRITGSQIYRSHYQPNHSV